LDENAPLISDSISDDDKIHFETITSILNKMNIPYIHDKKLVRGLDYYSHTTFEITSTMLGAQDALCGGGRYNGLVEQLGGKPTPAVGFAAGVERLILALKNNKTTNYKSDIYLVHIGEEVMPTALYIANELRNKCNKTVIVETLRRSLKAQMREAGRKMVKFALILGEQELQNNKIIIKNMETSNQKEISIDQLHKYFNT